MATRRSKVAKGKAKSKAGSLNPTRIIEVALAFWSSKTLLSAIELGLFTELAKGPLEAEALWERLGLNPRSARDFFDALVALGLLDRRGHQYRNTPETDLFLDSRQADLCGRGAGDG